MSTAGASPVAEPTVRPLEITCVPRDDARYPAALRDLPDPPRQLYELGDASVLLGAPATAVAIVGTRDATSYGLRVAEALGRAFAEAGAVVVSGMARGIDSAAHRGAIAAGGRTVAVLGTGVDVPYPVGNRGLHASVAASGLVVSESEPGRAAFPGCFPRRNRIIAALARLTIVVEAPFKSGALNTATQALELGRLVAAVPGPIDAESFAGSNTLLRDGAHVVASVGDALGLAGLYRNATYRPALGGLEAAVWDELSKGGRSGDDLAAALGVPAGSILGAVSALELSGLVAVGPDGTVGRVVLETAEIGG